MVRGDETGAFKHCKAVSFRSSFVPILTDRHESWIMTERISTQVQAPKMRFLPRLHGVTKGRTEVRLRPGQETSLAPPYLNLWYFGSKCTALKKKLTTLLRLFGPPQWFYARSIVPTCLRSWCYTSRQSAQLWNLQSPECQTTSPKWENTTTVRQFSHVSRMPNERLLKQVLLAKPTGKPPRFRPKARWSNCISDLAWSRLGVEPATELPEIAVDREVFHVLLWMLPGQPHP